MHVFLVFLSIARAVPFDEELLAARKDLIEGNENAAALHLETARVLAPEMSHIMPPIQLGRLWFYQGIISWKQGDQDAALVAWRQLLIMDPDFDWDDEVFSSSQASDLLQALRTEVEGRVLVDPQVPPRTGAAQLYVDGVLLTSESLVYEGDHFAQIQCPEGWIYGDWTNFDRRFDWLSLCPKSIDLTATYVPVDPTTIPPRPPMGRKISVPLLVGAGAVALVSGGLYNSALSLRTDFDDLDNASVTSPEDLNALQQQANNRVYASAATGGAALGLYAAAFFRW